MTKKMNDAGKKIIEKRVAAVLKAVSYRDEEDIRVDSVKLARFFGFTVEEDNLLQHEDGNINVSAPKGGKLGSEEKYIVVNRNHELSHYLLYYAGEALFMHRENKNRKHLEENDADYMAACLLMPEKSFKRQYNSLKDSRTDEELIEELQEKFCTPRESIIKRIDEVCREQENI